MGSSTLTSLFLFGSPDHTIDLSHQSILRHRTTGLHQLGFPSMVCVDGTIARVGLCSSRKFGRHLSHFNAQFHPHRPDAQGRAVISSTYVTIKPFVSLGFIQFHIVQLRREFRMLPIPMHNNVIFSARGYVSFLSQFLSSRFSSSFLQVFDMPTSISIHENVAISIRKQTRYFFSSLFFHFAHLDIST